MIRTRFELRLQPKLHNYQKARVCAQNQGESNKRALCTLCLVLGLLSETEMRNVAVDKIHCFSDIDRAVAAENRKTKI